VAEDEYHGMADEQDLEMTAKGKYPERRMHRVAMAICKISTTRAGKMGILFPISYLRMNATNIL
jgi:hypothetical protein